MIGKYKRFEKSEYDTCNDKAIEVVSTFLKSRGLVVQPKNKEDYKVDITCNDSSGLLTYYHEVEVKRVWDGQWPDSWKTIQVPERKGKFAKSDHYIWVLRNDLEAAWLIPGERLRKEFLSEVHNKKIRCGEYFYGVPKGLCFYVEFNKRRKPGTRGTIHFSN